MITAFSIIIKGDREEVAGWEKKERQKLTFLIKSSRRKRNGNDITDK